MAARPWPILLACAGLLLAVLLILLWPHGTRLPPGRENGLFENDCCGTLELRDGSMILNGRQKLRYQLGRDGSGPYVLPKTYVGAFEDKGIEIDGTRPVTRLRLDRLPRPERILLYEGPKPFAFERKPDLSRGQP